MNVMTVEIDQEEALNKYKQYRELVKTRKAKEYNELRRAYRALSKGQKVIDIYKAFKDTGADEKGPRLAIAPANETRISFFKEASGAGIFTIRRERWSKGLKSDVDLPSSTFSNWPTNKNSSWIGDIKDQIVGTNVPIVPAHLMPSDNLANYYILFEVDEWSPVAPVKDPYLLQRINANTFIVMAEWDVTEVEAIVMRGRNAGDGFNS